MENRATPHVIVALNVDSNRNAIVGHAQRTLLFDGGTTATTAPQKSDGCQEKKSA